MLNRRLSFLLTEIIIIIFIFCQVAISAEKTLRIDVRNRPPEMIVQGDDYSGPLIDVIKEVAEKNGFRTEFKNRQFAGSLEMLKKSRIDILPRTICTRERAAVIDYLGPIGYQEKDIVFIVKPGCENSISSFNDLKKLKIGTKRGTFYYKQFNDSQEITKIETADDRNLVRMFAAGRFDAFIALDRKSAESALNTEKLSEYAYAKYKHTVHIGNYFGIAPNHENYAILQKAIEKMVLTGRVKEIYKAHGATPPNFEPSMRFEGCFE